MKEYVYEVESNLDALYTYTTIFWKVRLASVTFLRKWSVLQCIVNSRRTEVNGKNN